MTDTAHREDEPTAEVVVDVEADQQAADPGAAESAVDPTVAVDSEQTAPSADADRAAAAAAAEEGSDEDGEGGEDPLEVEGEIAADYLEELLDIADLDGDIDTYVESGRAHVSLVTTSDVLVGRDGEVLDALQELARLAVVTSTGRRSRLMLDVAGHRERRRAELSQLAGEAVAEARDSGEAVRLKPMNPYERKIVHDAVAAAGLTSESEGEEPRRRVVVLP